MTFDGNSLRVLGSLMEKEMTTPDAYPLTLNMLLAASNQRSSREPVLSLTEDEVRQSLHVLEDAGLVAPARDLARVARYEHRIRTVLNLRRDETAVLCVLLLRGPQTSGELRGRTERMHSFDDLAGVQATLERMAARDIPLAAPLARSPGSREVRWTHLLGGPVESVRFLSADSAAGSDSSSAHDDSLRARVEALEERVRALEAHIKPSQDED